MALVASLLLALALGHVALRLLLSREGNLAVGGLLWISTAWPLGLGLASLTTFAVTPFSGAAFLPPLLVELALLAGLAWLATRRHADSVLVRTAGSVPLAVRLALGLAFAAAVAVFLRRTLDDPFGDADGIGIWNNRAVFWLRAAGQWDTIFAKDLAHTDYPLLVPLLQVRAWLWTGGEPGYPAAVHGGLFALCTYGALAGGIASRRGRALGAVGALALLATPFFAAHAASQSGDVPLACFLLLSIAWWQLGGTTTLTVVGACTALAAWTKNEGLLALGVLGGGVFLGALRRGGVRAASEACGRLLLGAAPALVAIALFKLLLAPANDMVANHDWNNLVPMLTSLERWRTVAVAFAEQLVVFAGAGVVPGLSLAGLLAAVLIAERGSPRAFVSREAAVVGTLVLLYLAIFLVSPYDLTWHVGTALDRLLLQVWPALLFAVLVRVRTVRLQG